MSSSHFWLEAQSCKHVELHLFYYYEELGFTLNSGQGQVMSYCAVDAKGCIGMLLIVCEYSNPLNHLSSQLELIIGILL